MSENTQLSNSVLADLVKQLQLKLEAHFVTIKQQEQEIVELKHQLQSKKTLNQNIHSSSTTRT